MRKWTIRFLLTIVALTSFTAAFVTLINHFDEPLRPEVQKILDKHVLFSEQQRKAYYYVLGLYAGEKENPEKRGEQLWLTHDQPGFWAQMSTNKPWQLQSKGCPANKCNTQTLIDHPELVESLKTDEQALKNYIHFVEYGESANLFVPNHETAFSPVQIVAMPVHRLFLLQLAQWLRQGGQVRVVDLITLSNRSLQGPLHSGNLLERMIATVLIRENLEFIVTERKHNPKLLVTQDLIDSIDVPDAHDILFGAAEVELRSFNSSIHMLNSMRQLEGLEASPQRLVDRLPLRAVLRPNETVNMFYEINQQALSSDCPAPDMSSCVPALKWTTFSNPWHYLSNPMGRALTAIMVSSINRQHTLQKRLETIGALREELRDAL